MPELPDLEYVVGRLQREVVGRTIAQVRVTQPSVLKLPVQQFVDGCTGQRLERVERVGHYVRWEVGPAQQLVMHLMLRGRFQLAVPGAPAPSELCWAFSLSEGGELRYLDDPSRGPWTAGSAQLLPRANTVKELTELGLPVLSEAFTLAQFQQAIAGRRDMVRNFLMDKKTLASIGNCYADEILFDARLHPQTKCTALTAPEVVALHGSIVRVLRSAVAEVARRAQPLEIKVRDFVQVRKRAGKPCPRCQTPIAQVKMGSFESNFCPTCQVKG